MLNIGFGNSVERAGVRVIVQPNSAPIKRFVKQKQEDGLLVDATMGKKLRAVIVMGSGHVVLSAISVASLLLRIEDE
ncbi:MAG: DUF370 domain-containing protein [bacterium]|nr:DUF370 domain-containing protein [bacterium]